MKRIVLVLMVALVAVGMASAQVTSPTQDVLGAHNVYGRGCIACHAPHSGAAANGRAETANSGNFILWGEDMSPLYGQTLTFGGGGYPVTLPNYLTGGYPASPADGWFDIIACLSCHDGNLAVSGMMTGHTYETVTINSASFQPPTLLGNDGTTPGNYLNDHPVGPSATFSCGGQYNWDCTVNANGSISFLGTNSSAFITDYYDVTSGNGAVNHLVKVAGATGAGSPTTTVASSSWVTCTTCHDQHDMLYFVTSTGTIKPTHFFVRGWYNPGNTNTSNSAAQFCRSCHGGESNEAHGVDLPTT